MKLIPIALVIVVSIALGGCFASIVNAYSGQDTTLKGNDLLVNSPANSPVLPDGGGGAGS